MQYNPCEDAPHDCLTPNDPSDHDMTQNEYGEFWYIWCESFTIPLETNIEYSARTNGAVILP